MKQEPDIADGEFRDFADLLITQVALELQVDDLPLILWQVFKQLEDLAYCFALFEAVMNGGIDTGLNLFEWSHATLLFARVEGQIAADREQPLSEVIADARRLFPAEPKERFLNDLSCKVRIS